MDDRFLKDLHEAPRPAFARALRGRLRRLETDDARPAFRLSATMTAAAALVVVAGLFLLPSVRASAHAFLEIFRVRQFTAVRFDPERLEKLRALKNRDRALLMFDETEVLRDPGRPQHYPSLEAAAAAAGLTARRVTDLPRGLVADSVFLEGEGEARLTLHASDLRVVLDEIGVTDVRLPDGFDGQPVHVKKRAVVSQRYRNERFRATLIQSRNPEVALPPGGDLAQLGEVGLRMLGLDAAEARRVARSIDWRTTLVVPVPLDASTFRPVTIRGHNGLLVTSTGGSKGERRAGSVVLWSDGDHLFAVETNLAGPDAVTMAVSVQ